MYLPCFPFAAHCAAGLSTCTHSRLPESRNFLHPCSKKLDQLNRKMGPVEVTNPSLIVFYLVVSLLENLVCIVVWNYCCILFLHLRLGEGESWSFDPIFECWDFRVRLTTHNDCRYRAGPRPQRCRHHPHQGCWHHEGDQGHHKFFFWYMQKFALCWSPIMGS